MRAWATKKRRNNSGMVLMLTLVAVAMLAILVYYAQIAAQVWGNSANRELQRAKLRTAARDVAMLAFSRLTEDSDMMVDHTNEIWAAEVKLEYPDGICAAARIEDEERRVNINNLAVPTQATGGRSAFQVLETLLSMQGRADPVNDVRALRRSLETSTTAAAPMHESLAELKDKIFTSTNEWARSSCFFTALPLSPARVTPVNVNTAPPEVLRATLGPGHEAMVEWLVGFRQKQPLAGIEPVAQAFGQAAFDEIRLFFDTRSRYFTVQARAWLKDAYEEVYALAERDDQGALKILRWVEQ